MQAGSSGHGRPSRVAGQESTELSDVMYLNAPRSGPVPLPAAMPSCGRRHGTAASRHAAVNRKNHANGLQVSRLEFFFGSQSHDSKLRPCIERKTTPVCDAGQTLEISRHGLTVTRSVRGPVACAGTAPVPVLVPRYRAGTDLERGLRQTPATNRSQPHAYVYPAPAPSHESAVAPPAPWLRRLPDSVAP